jgi:hypothetical protein
LERLMAMRRELVAEQARTAFFSALAGFQAECPVIPKTGEVKERGGQQVRYRFAPLDKIVSTIQPYLQKYELSYTFSATFDLDNYHLIAVCEVHHALGHTEASEFRVPISKDNFMNGAQHFGSASSYARRYALCNALGLLTGDEDDDANGAGKAQPEPRHPQRQAAPTPTPAVEQESHATTERRELLEQVTARCVELGYDTKLQLNARAKAATMSDADIKKKVIPSLDKLIEGRHKEEARLRTAIYATFQKAPYDYSPDDISEYLTKNHEGVALEQMNLEQLQKVAEGLEIK